jgi:hypothetical protein
VADALTFIARARPLRGTSYDEDERFEHGRSVIRRRLAESASEGSSDEALAAAQVLQAEQLYDCAEVDFAFPEDLGV